MAIARQFFPVPTAKFSLEQLARLVGGQTRGEGSFSDIAPLAEAKPNELSFFTNAKNRQDLKHTNAGAIVAPEYLKELTSKPLIITKNPRIAFAVIAHKFYPHQNPKVTTSPKIDPSARVHENALVENGAHIGAGSVVGYGSYIGGNCRLGKGVKIGEQCRISHAVLEDNVIIHSNVAIGEEGFGFALSPEGRYITLPHLGKVTIGAGSVIANGCSIIRGTMGDTIIGENCRLDTQVQVAHNVTLGKGVIVSSQVGISGSTSIGDYTKIGGQAGIMGHLKIGSKVSIFPKSGVMEDIADGMQVGGAPSIPLREFFRYARARAKSAREQQKKDN